MRTVTQGPSLSGFWGQAKTPGQGQAPPWVGVVETEGVYTHSGVMCPYLTRLSYRTAFQQQPGSFVELLVRSPTRVFLRSRGSCPAEPPSTSHKEQKAPSAPWQPRALEERLQKFPPTWHGQPQKLGVQPKPNPHSTYCMTIYIKYEDRQKLMAALFTVAEGRNNPNVHL